MIYQLKIKSIKRSMKTATVVILFGVFIMILSFISLPTFRREVVDFKDIRQEGLEDNALIRLNVSNNYGSYLTKSVRKLDFSGKRTNENYYFVGIGHPLDADFCLLSMVVLEEFEQEIISMFEGDTENDPSKPVEIICMAKKMKYIDKQYVNTLLNQNGYTISGESQNLLSYHMVYNDWETTIDTANFLWYFGLILILIPILSVLWNIFGLSLRKLKKVIIKSQYPMELVKEDYESARIFDKKNNFRVGRRFIFGFYKATPQAIINKDVVYAYYYPVTSYGKSYIFKKTKHYILFFDINEKTYFMEVSSKKQVSYIIDRMKKLMPWGVFEMDDNMNGLFLNDFQSFLDIKYNKIEDKGLIPFSKLNEDIYTKLSTQ